MENCLIATSLGWILKTETTVLLLKSGMGFSCPNVLGTLVYTKECQSAKIYNDRSSMEQVGRMKDEISIKPNRRARTSMKMALPSHPSFNRGEE